MTVKLLVLSFYYAPDLSAGAFRATALVRALVESLPPGGSIDVITTRPNRYSTFSVDVPPDEVVGPVRIRRVALPPHKSGMLDQSKAFGSFARAALRMTRGERYDVVFATSSRLMTAVLGSAIARRARAPLYLDIRDIFVDTMKDVLPSRIAWAFGPFLTRLERFAIRRASRISLVSEGFRAYFASRYPGARFVFFTNGIDDEFVGADWSAPTQPTTEGEGRSAAPFTVLYAGNIGDGQGLHAVVPALAAALNGRCRFRIIGDGGRRGQLERAVADAGVANVELLPPMSRQQLSVEYRNADVLFLHLNDYDAFRKVLPSKIFEYAATGKPVWAGVAGYSAEFLREHVANTAVFPPCDTSAGVRALESLTLQMTDRTAFVARFARRAISAAMADDILRVAMRRD